MKKAKTRVEKVESELAAARKRAAKAESQLVASEERVKRLDWSANQLVAVIRTLQEKLYVAGYLDCQLGEERPCNSKFNPSATSTKKLSDI